MQSFFQDDDDSDQERTETQRRQIQSIREESVSAIERGDGDTVRDGGQSEVEGLSEEQELEALRSNKRYHAYASISKKQAAITDQRENERKQSESSSQANSESEDLHLETSGQRHSPQEQPAGAISSPGQDNSSGIPSIKANHGESLRGQRNGGQRRIDPKIIDDSSDESSGDESDGSDDAPLGPSLPLSREPLNPVHRNIDHLPLHNVAVLGNSHDSYVSSIALDPAGNRLVSGSLDSTAKFWDFHAMNRSLRSFRTISPLFESPVRSVQYSKTGRNLLFAGGSSSAVITDREGVILSQTAKGDMYIVDSSRTKGHTGPVLAAKWKPGGNTPSTVVVTTSADATMRIWDISRTQRVPMASNPIVTQQRVIKTRNLKGAKVVASALDWLPDGKCCVIGCSDGRIRLVDLTSYSLRPVGETEGFVAEGEEVTSVVCAPDSCVAPLVLVRSTDDALRILDRRKFSQPLHEFEDLPNVISETNACFIGETGDYIMTGTSANRKASGSRGTVRLFDRQRAQEVWKSDMDENAGSVVCTLWHSSINQCIIGTGDGSVHVMYHPEHSHRGILSCISKSDYRKSHGVVSTASGVAIAASSLHYRGGRASIAHDGNHQGLPSKRQRRELSTARTPKQFTGPASLRQKSSISMAKSLNGKDVSTEWTQDPREAILKYAEIAKRDPQFTKAYQATQPESILAEKTAEQEEEDSRNAILERDRIATAAKRLRRK